MNDFTQNPQPEINITDNSQEMNAFLESLLYKGYVFDLLLDGNCIFYIITREKDNKLWLVSEKWWFNGGNFQKNEQWFDWIDTQEGENNIYIELRNNGYTYHWEISWDNITPWKNKSTPDINTLLWAYASKTGRTLN